MHEYCTGKSRGYSLPKRTHEKKYNQGSATSAHKLPRLWWLGLLLVAVAAAVAGVAAGNWMMDKLAAREAKQQTDEYVGLAERTGMTGDLELLVSPLHVTVYPGEPVKADLTLVNRGRRTLMLNGWLTPVPANMGNNQFPLKVRVSGDSQPAEYRGNYVLFPPHKKRDFFPLEPMGRKTFTADLSSGPNNGRWILTTPGEYKIEAWYETYLTGRYAGVKAWTGMTNHVVVGVSVRPRRGG